MSPVKPASAASACWTAWAVPSCGSCTTTWPPCPSTSGATCSRPAPTTTTTCAGASSSTAASRWASIGRPARGWRTLCRSDFIRVPMPAARMMAATGRAVVMVAASRTEMLKLPLLTGRRPAMLHPSPRSPLTSSPSISTAPSPIPRADLAAALNHALVRLGRRAVPEDEVRHLVGHGARALLRRGLAVTGEASEALVETGFPIFIDYYRDHICVGTRPYEGLEAALDRLAARGVRLALCTNKAEDADLALLDALGWHGRFDSVVGGDTLPVRKPDPAPLLRSDRPRRRRPRRLRRRLRSSTRRRRARHACPSSRSASASPTGRSSSSARTR